MARALSGPWLRSGDLPRRAARFPIERARASRRRGCGRCRLRGPSRRAPALTRFSPLTNAMRVRRVRALGIGMPSLASRSGPAGRDPPCAEVVGWARARASRSGRSRVFVFFSFLLSWRSDSSRGARIRRPPKARRIPTTRLRTSRSPRCARTRSISRGTRSRRSMRCPARRPASRAAPRRRAPCGPSADSKISSSCREWTASFSRGSGRTSPRWTTRRRRCAAVSSRARPRATWRGARGARRSRRSAEGTRSSSAARSSGTRAKRGSPTRARRGSRRGAAGRASCSAISMSSGGSASRSRRRRPRAVSRGGRVGRSVPGAGRRRTAGRGRSGTSAARRSGGAPGRWRSRCSRPTRGATRASRATGA